MLFRRPTRTRNLARAAIAVSLAMAGATAVATSPAYAVGETVRFGCVHGSQAYAVPADAGSVRVFAVGASGSLGTNGGFGGSVDAVLAVAPGTVLTVEVGCADGYNGGAPRAGGGASDVRLGGSSLNDRVVVAGGGGGEGAGAVAGRGGAGGLVGLPGAPGIDPAGALVRGGDGGTPLGGGAGGSGAGGPCLSDAAQAGSFGSGGEGAVRGDARGGGGGGGFYGGGGGAASCTTGAGGGGGSSFGPPGATYATGVNLGHGYVEITSLPAATPTTPSPDAASDDCDGGTSLVDGFAGDGAASSYVAVKTSSPDPLTTWLCVRAYSSALRLGGKFVVTAPVGGVGSPTVDAQYTACGTTPGNTIPSPHPLASGAIGDPGDPATYVPYLLDAHSGNSTVSVCARVGDSRVRILLPVAAGVVVPSVAFVPDPPGGELPASPPAPATPSATCRPASVRLVDTVVAGTRVFARYDDTVSAPALCVRLSGLVNAGGVLSISGGTGVPALETSTTDMSPCTVQVVHNDEPVIDVRRSATGAVPASICVTVGGTALRVTVGGSGGTPPSVTWSPDPGTPGAP